VCGCLAQALDNMEPAGSEEVRSITREGRTFLRLRRLHGFRAQWQKLVTRSEPPYDRVWFDYAAEQNARIDNAYMDMETMIDITTPGPHFPTGHRLMVTLNEPFIEWIWPQPEERESKVVRRVWVKDNDDWDNAEPWMALERQATPAPSSSSSTRASP
jgi:hypothetical protein